MLSGQISISENFGRAVYASGMDLRNLVFFDYISDYSAEYMIRGAHRSEMEMQNLLRIFSIGRIYSRRFIYFSESPEG